MNNLIAWIKTKVETENNIESLISECMKAGWDYNSSIYAVEIALNKKIERYITPHPLSEDGKNINLGDRFVRVNLYVDHPKIIIIENMLSNIECDELMVLANNRFSKSKIINEEKMIVSNYRTSQTSSFKLNENDLITRIDKRLSKFLCWPINRCENLQVQKYNIGEQYLPHYDYFEENSNITGNRVATVIVYLNEPIKGGETLFSDIQLKIIPKKGMAVFFTYDRPYPTTMTKHAGCPVLAGEKWILTKWVHNLE